LGTLVQSARLLRAGVIVLMGWGTLEAELRVAISTTGLEERIMLLPPVPQSDVVRACSHATVGVIPYEPRGLNNLFSTPNKLFDFMAAGVPLIGTQMPELTRFIVGCAIGVTVPSGDVARLASGIQDLLDHPERRWLMRANALEASKRYCWDEEKGALLELYAPETVRSGAASPSPRPVS
jgi:glycosyltransferase involved in cell wall biosynthesis